MAETNLHRLTIRGDVDAIRKLLESSADVNEPDEVQPSSRGSIRLVLHLRRASVRKNDWNHGCFDGWMDGRIVRVLMACDDG